MKIRAELVKLLSPRQNEILQKCIQAERLRLHRLKGTTTKRPTTERAPAAPAAPAIAEPAYSLEAAK